MSSVLKKLKNKYLVRSVYINKKIGSVPERSKGVGSSPTGESLRRFKSCHCYTFLST